MTEESPRERIVSAALELLEAGGQDAVSTRAVSVAADVQSPTIYRHFGDKQGLLDAVAVHGFERYLSGKGFEASSGDPVADLRRGWDLHVEMGLANPALYTLMYGQPRSEAVSSPAARAAFDHLSAVVGRIAEAGRLRVPVPRAAAVVHAAGSGVTLSLIATVPERRDRELSVTTREAVVSAITTERPAVEDPGPRAAAVALRAALPRAGDLTAAESALLAEWLDRIAAG